MKNSKSVFGTFTNGFSRLNTIMAVLMIPGFAIITASFFVTHLTLSFCSCVLTRMDTIITQQAELRGTLLSMRKDADKKEGAA